MINPSTLALTTYCIVSVSTLIGKGRVITLLSSPNDREHILLDFIDEYTDAREKGRTYDLNI